MKYKSGVLFPALRAAVCALLILSALCSCGSEAAGVGAEGILSREILTAGSRIFHAARISDTFEYIEPGKPDNVLIPCEKGSCAHNDDTCPAYIRGLTCYAAESETDIYYAQMRAYIDSETHTGARHNVIARLDVTTGVTYTLLQDWEYVIDELMLCGDDIFFLSKNADGLRDIWRLPKAGGTPELYIQNDGVNMSMLAYSDGVLYFRTENGGVFRADLDSTAKTVTLTQLVICDYSVGIYVYGGYIYYPVKDRNSDGYIVIPDRTVYNSETGEYDDIAVAVNSCSYYRIACEGGEPEFLISGVQATEGGLCENGMLYLPMWNYKYYGSVESDGIYTDYYSLSGGSVAAIELDTLKAEALTGCGEWDFSRIYAVTDAYIVGVASDPASGMSDAPDTGDKYIYIDRANGSAYTIAFN